MRRLRRGGVLQETMCDETAKGECCRKQLCMRSKKAKAAIRDWCCGKADLKEEIMVLKINVTTPTIIAGFMKRPPPDGDTLMRLHP